MATNISRITKIIKSCFCIKEYKWNNVHSEFKSCESDKFYSSGEEMMCTFYSRWLILFWIPVWRLKHTVKAEPYNYDSI